MELFCIKHEKMYHAEHAVCRGVGHTAFISTSFWRDEFDIEFCCFDYGYAFSPPPVFPNVEREPFVEELEAAEQSAEEFMLDLALTEA